MLTVNLFLVAASTFLIAAAMVSVCGMRRSAVYPGTLLWVAFEFAVDLTLIGIFNRVLYSPHPPSLGDVSAARTPR